MTTSKYYVCCSCMPTKKTVDTFIKTNKFKEVHSYNMPMMKPPKTNDIATSVQKDLDEKIANDTLIQRLLKDD